MINIKQFPVIIIDFGSQYTQLIARRIRDIGVYCEIHPYNIEKTDFDALKPCGVILSGGPASVTCDLKTLRAPDWLFMEINLPILGICYGMQTMALQLGGEVKVSHAGEFGYAELKLKNQGKLFHAIQDRLSKTDIPLLDVWMSHGDSVTALPAGFDILCETESTPIAGMAHEKYPWYGLQFHPEVTQTRQGSHILERFIVDICGAKTEWTAQNIIDNLIEEVRKTVKEEHVLLGLSGGVDSTVVAALLQKAIGDQLVAIFVDTGLLRAQETEQVTSMLGENLNIRLIVVDAREQFLQALAGVSCPEEKRKIIGHTFINVFEKEAQSLPKVRWLAQGTIYPDVIESAAVKNQGTSMVIKSHHNVGGLPETLNLALLEPIRELFKDEVRKIGSMLGLPESMVYRHPFPGPGLGVRIIGEIKAEYIEILRKADSIFIEELKIADLYSKVSQAFAVFLPIKSVGVVGDGRRYEYVIALRAVETIDFMTADWAPLPWEFLAKVSSRIVNETPNVSRVTYDISSKPPATIEWE